MRHLSKNKSKTSKSRRGVFSALNSIIKGNTVGELLVKAGKLTPQDLRSLLKTQKMSGKRLGLIAIESGFIKPHSLFLILFKQRAIRSFATITALTLSIFCLTHSKSRAGSIKDVAAKIQVVATPDYNKFSYLQTHPAIFGMKEVKATNIKPFKKWTGMFEKFDEQLSLGSKASHIRQFQDSLKTFSKMETHELIKNVNDLVNSVEYIEDSKNWNKSDYWATPVEFFSRGGDCEDFAIAKYVALRALGFPENRLRLTIVTDLIKKIPHAVLIVYTDEGPVILDNQSDEVKFTEDVFRYKPIFSINRHAWWLHKAPERPANVIASAAN